MSEKITTLSSKMVASKTKNKALTCSTPEHRLESPSRDSDSLCDSETASPVPFLCTQDGAEGETDVVWNFYTPKADHAPTSRFKNTTPLSRKAKKSLNPRQIEKPVAKRRVVKPSQKRTELFQDLIELNQNLHKLITKKTDLVTEKPQSGSEEDIFNDSGDSSPKSAGYKTNSRCLRRNVLSSKFSKQDTEAAMESDDSMNECLIKASQVVEENIFNQPTPAKRACYESSKSIKKLKPGINLDNDSMDAILNSIKLDSPFQIKTKCDSPKLNNDSFDSIVGNLNDSALERLTQMPVKNNSKSKLNNSNAAWTVQDIIVNDESPSNKSVFARHNSMPESPSVAENKPSISGMSFGRHNSMPYKNNVSGDSPIRCTPDEIKRKHQQAREKLLAKQLLPFTSSQQPSQPLLSTQPTTQKAPKKNQFQPRAPSSTVNKQPTIQNSKNIDTTNIKLIIEKKRQEALMKLRRRQPQNNSR